MELSKEQQINRVCITTMLISGYPLTWDNVAKNAGLIIQGLEMEIRTRDVLENWPKFFPVQGEFDPSKHQGIDKTGIEMVYGV